MTTYLLNAAESLFVWYLSRTVVKGRLVLNSPSKSYSIPDEQLEEDPGPFAELTVHNPAFFLRVLTSPSTADLIFAEEYMHGDLTVKSHEDLIGFFKIFIINRDKPIPTLPSAVASFLSLPATILSVPAGLIGCLLPTNILTTARKNISAHYDLGNEMFKVFLSKDMTYSCAIFPSLDADLKDANRRTWIDANHEGDNVVDPLHDAQIRKLQHIIHRADIRPGHRVLEIGSGWGSLALQIVRTIPDTTVDTITLSTEQADHVRGLIQQDAEHSQVKINGTPDALPVGDRIRVHLMDFRAMPEEWMGKFDRVVSVEMVEAIGKHMYEKYFGAIDWALKPHTGVGVVQGITIPEARYDTYAKLVLTCLQIFPGGILPTVTHLTDAIVAGSVKRLLVESVENIGPHYARTLREWRRRFENGFDEIEEALKLKYPKTMNDSPAGRKEIDVFRRKWIYYFCYCEAGFVMRTLGDHIVTFTREGNVEYGCHIFI